jgi:hypothetical protein
VFNGASQYVSECHREARWLYAGALPGWTAAVSPVIKLDEAGRIGSGVACCRAGLVAGWGKRAIVMEWLSSDDHRDEERSLVWWMVALALRT